ncbi:hypothetical protein AB0383_19660 [Amycolatopsis sp. NPDC051373]|uniref:hypothetical protein n=1 Tax=Amycolatopsis sp. NPDC051373 TaxID=3155801 RepID=UPI00344FA46F
MADTAGLQPENLVMGPARLYICKLPFDPTLAYEPALTDVNLTPAASAWYDTGITLGGSSVTVSPTWTMLTGDQLPDKLGGRLTDRDITCTLNFAEMTGPNLKYAWNMTDGPTGANYKVYDLDAGQTANRSPYRTLLVDGLGPDTVDGSRSLKRRAILRKTLPTGDTALQWAKADQQVLASTFQGFFVAETKSPIRVIDEVAA